MGKLSFFINRIANNMSAVAMLLLTFVTVIDVAGRYFFNHPLPGTIEITELSLVVIVYLAFGFAEHHKEHVVIDTLYEMMPKLVKRIFYLLSGAMSFSVILLMAWQLYIYSGRMKAGNYHTGVLGIPYSPIVLVASIGTAFYAFAIISNIIEFYREKRRGDNK